MHLVECHNTDWSLAKRLLRGNWGLCCVEYSHFVEEAQQNASSSSYDFVRYSSSFRPSQITKPQSAFSFISASSGAPEHQRIDYSTSTPVAMSQVVATETLPLPVQTSQRRNARIWGALRAWYVQTSLSHVFNDFSPVA